jgi:CDP-diacylglycerol---serine O-phosphatidyltransferase
MRKIAEFIPNLLTLGNFLAGCAGLIAAFGQELHWAAACIWIGAGFDFLDGFAARLLRVQSLLGKQLDSLADVCTFGILPAAILYAFWLQGSPGSDLPAFTVFLLAAAAALRLARFNIDERQNHSFLGLPTPATALLVSGLPALGGKAAFLASGLQKPYFLAALTLVLAGLMISELPLFSFKFTDFSWSHNRLRYLFLGLSLALSLALGPAALPIIVMFYVILSAATALTLNKPHST